MNRLYISNLVYFNIIPNFRPLIVRDGYIIGVRGYNIYLYNSRDGMIKQSKVVDYKYSLLASRYLLRRFLRAEIINLYELSDETQLLITKKGIFRKRSASNKFIKCFNIMRGSRPRNLCVDNKNNIYFGEYFSNFERNQVNIYNSIDGGKTWEIAYTFKKGEINHIHGIFYDKYTNRKWVVTGDRENECIIAYTENDFGDLNIVFRGGQEYRTCSLLFYEDFIVFVTDSEYMKNEIKKFDRQTFKITSLGSIQGSGLYAGQCNSFSFLSTTVEPSKINKDKYSHLYISKDGLEWKEIAKYRKDIWNKSIFQFGSIQFPRYENQKDIDYIVYYGRALKQIGGKTVIQSIK